MSTTTISERGTAERPSSVEGVSYSEERSSPRSDYFRSLGWTVEAARERLAGCRSNARDFHTLPEATRWTYRALNAGFYCRYRAILSTLTR